MKKKIAGNIIEARQLENIQGGVNFLPHKSKLTHLQYYWLFQKNSDNYGM